MINKPFGKSSLRNILQFLHKSEKLKTLLRHSWLSSDKQESVAEHTWRIALMAIILKDYLKTKVNLEKVLSMIIIHDLPEIFAGDHHAWRGKLENKYALEKKGLIKLLGNLPPNQKTKILDLWQEYEDKKTPEAKFAKALDKLETIDQHNLASLKTWVKEEYSYNLVHGKEEVKFDKVLQDFKNLIDKQTKMKIKKGK